MGNLCAQSTRFYVIEPPRIQLITPLVNKIPESQNNCDNIITSQMTSALQFDLIYVKGCWPLMSFCLSKAFSAHTLTLTQFNKFHISLISQLLISSSSDPIFFFLLPFDFDCLIRTEFGRNHLRRLKI
jgi:hypothetical protein